MAGRHERQLGQAIARRFRVDGRIELGVGVVNATGPLTIDIRGAVAQDAVALVHVTGLAAADVVLVAVSEDGYVVLGKYP